MKSEKRKRRRSERTGENQDQREIIAWFWVGLVFLLINGTIGQARVIPSGSMENTLLIGDHLIMSPRRLRRRRALHQLARAALAQSQTPASHHLQAAVCPGHAGTT